MNKKTVVSFILRMENHEEIVLFNSTCESWNASEIDDLFASEIPYTLAFEFGEIAGLINKNRASLWALDSTGDKEVLLAAFDIEQSDGDNVFWFGRRSTLELFGILNFKYAS